MAAGWSETSDGHTPRRGALSGIRIVEFAGIGPAPFAAMMLADHGAEIIRIERMGDKDEPTNILNRSRAAIVRLDLKTANGVADAKALIAEADGLIEGFRPGVMERLGLGPEVLLKENQRLVYGRMTGWGQEGPLASAAGHDINYIALVGALNAFGRVGEKPTPPINLVGDFGGGGMMLAFGMLAGLLSARSTGQGQVIDCAMTDGASLLMAMTWGFRAQGIWSDTRGTNYLDTGAPYYDTYRTADDRYVALGAIEPQFNAAMCEALGLTGDPDFSNRDDPALHGRQRARLETLFATRSQAEWVDIFAGHDACFAPVLDYQTTPAHPHNVARGAFIDIDGVRQPAPAPRFSLTPAAIPHMRPATQTSED